MPPMVSSELGRIWVSRLVRGKTEGVRMVLPFPGFSPGLPGDIVVETSDNSGSSLSVRGGEPGYAAREGQFFSVRTAGQNYLYMVAEEVVFDGAGNAVIPVSPMLRVQHTDGDVCDFSEPEIEGMIQGDELAWGMSMDHTTSIQFSIVEVG